MKRVLLLGILAGLIGCEREPALPQDAVLLRLLNNSDVRFDSVKVNDVNFGSIGQGEFSKYKVMEGLFLFGMVDLFVQGKRFNVLSAPHGQAPLPDGRYTYILSLDLPTGQLHLDHFEGDNVPRGAQEAGRSRVIRARRRFDLYSSVLGSGGRTLAVGTQSSEVEINPTISSNPFTRVIYLPNARVSGITYQGVFLTLDANGRRESLRTYGDDDGLIKGFRAIAGDSIDGYILAGFADRLVTGGLSVDTDGWIVRVDARGEQPATRYIGHIGHSPAPDLVYSAVQAPNGFMIGGASSGSAWYGLLDRAGHATNTLFLSNPNLSSVERVRPARDGFILVTAPARGDSSSVVIVNPSLQVRRTIRVRGTATDAAQLPDGGYVVSGAVGVRGQVTRVDSVGKIAWSRQFEATTIARAVVDTESSYLAVGGPDSAVLRVAKNGNDHSGRLYGSDALHSIQPMPDGGFVFAGESGRVLRIAADGRVIWDYVLRSN